MCQSDVFDAFHGRVLSDSFHPDGHSYSLMNVQPGLQPLLLTLQLGYRKHLNMLVSFPRNLVTALYARTARIAADRYA